MTPHQLAKRIEAGEAFSFKNAAATIRAAMPNRNGCFDRKPFVDSYYSSHGDYIKNFSSGAKCHYTETALGQADAGCVGCKWKDEPKDGE